MKEPKIDEEHLQHLSKLVRVIVDALSSDKNIMMDQNEDIFKRYMSYVRLSSFFISLKFTQHNIKELLRLGHDLNHDIFKTDGYKNNNWDEIEINSNPFFINKEEQDNESNDLNLEELFNSLLSKLNKNLN